MRAVLFDLDGTLIDTVRLIRESMGYATMHVLGEELPDDELMRNVGIPLLSQMRAISEKHAEELVTVYRAHNAEVHDDLIAEYPGTEQVLEELAARGYPLAIVTSKSSPVAMRGIELFGLERFFSAIVCSDHVERHKPDPFPLVVAARELGFGAEECMYVGDSPHDMTAAVRARAVSVAALWGAFDADSVLEPGPEFAIDRISQLTGLLAGDTEPYAVRRSAGCIE